MRPFSFVYFIPLYKFVKLRLEMFVVHYRIKQIKIALMARLCNFRDGPKNSDITTCSLHFGTIRSAPVQELQKFYLERFLNSFSNLRQLYFRRCKLRPCKIKIICLIHRYKVNMGMGNFKSNDRNTNSFARDRFFYS